MPLQTGSQILSVTPRPNQALGSDTEIPVIADTARAYNIVNSTARDMMLLNHDNNIKLYDQKIKDRDKTNELLIKGNISSGKILEQDRPVYDKAKKATNDAFFKMIKAGGISNQAAYKEYINTVGELNDVVNQAQGREIQYAKIKSEQSKEKNPNKISNYQNHLDKELNQHDFWHPIDPYQSTLDFNDDALTSLAMNGASVGGAGTPRQVTDKLTVTDKNGKVTTTNTQTSKPATGKQPLTGDLVMENGVPMDVKRGYVDFDKIYNNVQSGYIDDKSNTAEQMRMRLRYVSQQPVEFQQQYLGNIVNKARQYNAERGFEPDENGDYPKGGINVDRLIQSFKPRDVNDAKKGYDIGLSPYEFEALSQLAKLPKFTEETKTFNKDIDNSRLKWAELAAKKGALKALESERYSKSNLNYKKAKALDDQFNPEQVFNEIFKGKMKTVETTNNNVVTRINLADMSKELHDVLGINPINQNGDYNLVPANIKIKGKDGKIKQMQEDIIWKGYPNWLKSEQATKIKTAKGGELPSVFDYIYSQPGTTFEVEVEGKTKPVTTKGKDGRVIVTDKGGKLIRSNQLQALLTQMNKGGVKGKELLNLLSDEGDSGSATSEELSTSTTTKE